jgi:hypothetical protein
LNAARLPSSSTILQAQELELPAQRTPEPILDFIRLDRREKADFAVVDGKHGHFSAGVALERLQDRAVAAEHHAQLDVLLERGV